MIERQNNKKMNKYRVYRSIRVNSIDDVNMNELGISWAVGESEASNFSNQFGDDYIVISAIVSEDQINIAQTNAQWNSEEHAHEGEVVLNDLQDIEIEYNGKTFFGRINDMNAGSDETRPDPEECDNAYVTDYLEKA